MERVKNYIKSVLKISLMMFLLFSTVLLGIFYNYLYFALALSVVYYAIYDFYKNEQKQKKIDLKEFKFAVERFYASIKTLQNDMEQIDLMMAFFAKQFSRTNQVLSNFIPEEKTTDISVLTYKKETPSYDAEWLEVLKIYNEKGFEYPDKKELVKLSPQMIHQHCNRIDEYNLKLSFFGSI